MQILVTAATGLEIHPFASLVSPANQMFGPHHCSTGITGVGLFSTGFHLVDLIEKLNPDLIIQAGICGTFNKAHPPGSVVIVGEEYFGDTGVWENGRFSDLFDMGLQLDEFPFLSKTLANPDIKGKNWNNIPVVKGVSVNQISSRVEQIAELKRKYNPDVESMEGAAFHYVCLMKKVKFLQIRGVSNFTGDRNKNNWKMEEAIGNLNNSLVKIISEYL
ncbi:MAG TPA: futalosine hydrolase [Parasegetibacter sp.]|jgi:futalosine hydrolase